MTQIDSMRFRIAKADHEKALRAFAKILEYQQSHPELYYYTRSRSYFMQAEDNPDQEIWMFIDEYNDRKRYWSPFKMRSKMIPSAQKTFAHSWS
jgi:hypothetical protein